MKIIACEYPIDKTPVNRGFRGWIMEPSNFFTITIPRLPREDCQAIKDCIERTIHDGWDLAAITDLIRSKNAIFLEMEADVIAMERLKRDVKRKDADKYDAIARLLVGTYFTARMNALNIERLIKLDDLQNLTRYTFTGPLDDVTCQKCRDGMKRNYLAKELPKIIPQCWGCRCQLGLDTKDILARMRASINNMREP